MNFFGKLSLSFSVMLFASSVMAQWSGWSEVKKVGSNNTNVKIELSDEDAAITLGSCTNVTSFRISQNDVMSNQAFSLALAAFSAKKRIRVSGYECKNSSVLINDIEVQE